MKVNILHQLDRKLFTQHFARNLTFDVHENSDAPIEWDLVVVFENVQEAMNIRCRDGGLVFIGGEPPESTVYTPGFVRQFDRFYSVHPEGHHNRHWEPRQYFNDWHFGLDYPSQSHRYTYEALRDMQPPAKTKSISVVTSTLAAFPRHIERLEFLRHVRDRFGNAIDFFGRGHNFVNDKADALIPYRFHIAIENCNTPGLWTEKLADPILGFSLPIYSGCTNAGAYLPAGSYLPFSLSNIGDGLALIESVLRDGDALYQLRLPALIEARRRVLEDLNISSELATLLGRTQHNSSNVRSIRRNEQFKMHKLQHVGLRLRRIAWRLAYKSRSLLTPVQHSGPSRTE